jgi:hypothetical protein
MAQKHMPAGRFLSPGNCGTFDVREQMRIQAVSSSVCPQNPPIDYFNYETLLRVGFSTLQGGGWENYRKSPGSRRGAIGTVIALRVCGTA